MNDQLLAHVLILGDVMLDRYTHGVAHRASPEAPVLILDADHEEARLGGAGAVAALIAGLGAAPIVAGVVGDDASGGDVMELLDRIQPGCDRAPFGASATCGKTQMAALLQAPGRPTTVKERLIGSAAGRHPQQLLRVDRESRRPLSGELEEKLLTAAIASLANAKVVIISDYGKGVCTPKIVQSLIAAARGRRLPVLVDPRRGADYAIYRFATVIKPNRYEAGEALGHKIRTRAEAFAAGRELCRRWNFQAAVITLDADGLVLTTADDTEAHFAADSRQVLDVTGAGDTVLAMLGAALSRGTTLSQACRLAVHAAGLQVERFGVSPVSWHEVTEDGLPSPSSEGGLQSPAIATPAPCPLVSLFPCQPAASETQRRQQCAAQQTRATTPSPCQPISVDVLINQLACHRCRGEKIVFTNGCFDLFHAGHLHCLTAAKALGDVLVVAINSDAGVRRLKGDLRPIVRQDDRAALVAALACVDYVTLFDEDTPERLIAALRPDVLIKGAETYPDGIPGEAMVRSYGGRVELIPHIPGHSTTSLSLSLRASVSTHR